MELFTYLVVAGIFFIWGREIGINKGIYSERFKEIHIRRVEDDKLL